VGNIATDVPPCADAVFSRDFLAHLPLAQTEQVIARWPIAGFRYVFATTFGGCDESRDCRLGGWRPLDMQALNCPAPLAVIAEREPNPRRSLPLQIHGSVGLVRRADRHGIVVTYLMTHQFIARDILDAPSGTSYQQSHATADRRDPLPHRALARRVRLAGRGGRLA
jgi:hypothetical protein